MANSVSKVIALEFNGVNFEDFNSVTPGEKTMGKQVELMNKTNFADMTVRHTFQVGVVRPVDGFSVDPEKIKNGTATYELDNGKRFTYGEVNTMSVGEGTINGTDEYSYPITYSAGSLTEE